MTNPCGPKLEVLNIFVGSLDKLLIFIFNRSNFCRVSGKTLQVKTTS